MLCFTLDSYKLTLRTVWNRREKDRSQSGNILFSIWEDPL